jgi:hypothetical protein
LTHTSGCDEDVPKERIITKRRTQTVLDNRLTPTFFELEEYISKGQEEKGR